MNTSKVIIRAGFLVGTLDICSAFLYVYIKTNENPLIVLPYITSALFGQAAFEGGVPMYFFGLLLHYIVAFSFTLFFFWIYPKLKLFSKNRIFTGIIYGVFVWTIMNLVIVPNTRIPSRPFDEVNAVINAIILIVCIGLPLSFIAEKHYTRYNSN